MGKDEYWPQANLDNIYAKDILKKHDVIEKYVDNFLQISYIIFYFITLW